MVREKMIKPFVGCLSGDAEADGTLFILKRDNGDKSVILRYDPKREIMDDSSAGIVSGEEEDIYNECICSRLNAVSRMMISFKSAR